MSAFERMSEADAKFAIVNCHSKDYYNQQSQSILRELTVLVECLRVSNRSNTYKSEQILINPGRV
jgi:hypothetical protein